MIQQRICDNIRAYAKQNGIGIGDIENRIGVSVGYLSRNRINIEKVVAFCGVYHIDIYDLVYTDFSKEYEIKTLIAEIDKKQKELNDLRLIYENKSVQ